MALSWWALLITALVVSGIGYRRWQLGATATLVVACTVCCLFGPAVASNDGRDYHQWLAQASTQSLRWAAWLGLALSALPLALAATRHAKARKR